MNRKDLSRLVQFLTGHNKLKRHKNLQNGVDDPHSCRLCFEEEESSFHVIAECPATQTVRTRVFELPSPIALTDPPDWTISQVVRFLKESSVGDLLNQSRTYCKVNKAPVNTGYISEKIYFIGPYECPGHA